MELESLKLNEKIQRVTQTVMKRVPNQEALRSLKAMIEEISVLETQVKVIKRGQCNSGKIF